MADQSTNPRRRKKRRSRKLYNLALTVVGTLSVALIIFSICGIVDILKEQGGPSLGGDQSPSVNVTDPTKQDPTTTDPAQTDPPPTSSPSYDQAELDTLLAEAEFIAAGYDYLKAIDMLTSWEHYADVPALAEKVAEYRQLDSQLVVYDNPQTVTHIFFHSLIVDTDRAFDGDYDTSTYHTYFATVDEFNAIMEEMYKRGYVLISPYDLAYDDGNGFTYGQIRLPAGKIPFILSQDDLNYYSYMISSGNGEGKTPYWADKANDGFASKIVVGEDGYPTCEYVDANGNVLYGDYDLVPCLETFIQSHPDFSYHGARAILGMTGFEGVFGYRTKPSYEQTVGSEIYNAEVAAAKEVAQCLRDHGWILASHSYGHPAYGNISIERVENDSDKWVNTVASIIGDCDVILYPHGSDIEGGKKYTFDNAKFAALYEDGFRYFFNVDGSKYWNQLGPNYFRGGRRNIDGYRMYRNPEMLEDLFDVKDVWDNARPKYEPVL